MQIWLLPEAAVAHCISEVLQLRMHMHSLPTHLPYNMIAARIAVAALSQASEAKFSDAQTAGLPVYDAFSAIT